MSPSLVSPKRLTMTLTTWIGHLGSNLPSKRHKKPSDPQRSKLLATSPMESESSNWWVEVLDLLPHMPLGSGDVDLCLVPEVPIVLEGKNGCLPQFIQTHKEEGVCCHCCCGGSRWGNIGHVHRNRCEWEQETAPNWWIFEKRLWKSISKRRERPQQWNTLIQAIW